jgi:undecaprenyl pyrophosphate phosphatase UppP
MKFLQSRSTWVFVWYRVALGLVILGMAFSGRLGGV